MNIPRRSLCLVAPFALLSAVPATQAATLAFNFDANDAGWTSSMVQTFDNPWTYTPGAGTGGTGAWTTNGQGPDSGHSNTTLLTSPVFTVMQAGGVTLSFDHMFSFEGGNWDGGAVQVSVNGGAFTTVSSASFTSNGYTGSIVGYGANGAPGVAGESDLAGQLAFSGDSPGRDTGTFINSVANLGNLAAGNTFSLRFMAASDTNTQGAFAPQWVIDNVSVTNVVPEPGIAGLAGLAALGMLRRKKR
jgi:MYXO-CTERM domain-containing protein